MSDWTTGVVRDVAAPKGLVGGPFGSALGSKDYVDDGVPVIRGVNLGSPGYFDSSEFVYVTEEKAYGELSRNLAQPGDVVFTQRGTLGQVGIVPEGGYEIYVISQSQMRLRVDQAKALPHFIYYQFRSPMMVETIRANAIATGVPHINLGILGSLPIVIPPLDEQRRIAALLGALDGKIAVNDRIAATYEDIFQAKFAALGTAEEGDCAITELVEFNPRTPRPDQNEAVYVDMAALPTRQSSIRAWAHRPPKGGSRFQNGDTLLARITPCLENGKTGFVDLLRKDEIGTGSTEFIVMRSRKGVPPEFSYFLARDGRFRKHAIRKMVGSSGRQRVSAADAAHFFVRRPDSGQLAAFGAEVGVAFRHMKSLMEESRVLGRLRDTLLPELMSGRLRVKDAEKVAEEAI